MDDLLLRYRRLGGSPPPSAELLDVARDGAFDLWRTRAESFPTTTPIGRFRGTVDPDLLNHVLGLAGAAGAPPSVGPAPAGSPIDRVELPGVGEVESDGYAALPQPWADLRQQAQELAVDLTAQPAGSVGLEVTPSSARLVHLGDEPLTLDLSGAQVRVLVWSADGGIGPQWSWREGSLPDTLELAGGATFDLPFDHPLDPSAGRLVAYVDLRLLDGERWLDGSLESGIT
jgi:hypothetical protein